MADACGSVLQIAEIHETWTARLPSETTGLWDWCLAQPQDVLLALLAHLGVLAVDAVRLKGERADSTRLVHTDAFAKAAGFVIADQFMPDVATYSGRINSAKSVTALCAAKGVPAVPAWSRMKIASWRLLPPARSPVRADCRRPRPRDAVAAIVDEGA